MVVGVELSDLARLFERMLVSIDVDCYTPRDPGRVFDLVATLGQGSAFEAEHGYYLDPISPNLPTLPENWHNRLVRLPLQGGITLLFLDPNDAAVSKYARADPRDREWIRAGLQAGVLHAGIIASRFRETRFFDEEERARACAALAEDRAEGRG